MLFVVWIPNPDGQYDVETLTPPAWSICGPAARLCSPKPPCTPLMRLGWLFRHPKNSELTCFEGTIYGTLLWKPPYWGRSHGFRRSSNWINWCGPYHHLRVVMLSVPWRCQVMIEWWLGIVDVILTSLHNLMVLFLANRSLWLWWLLMIPCKELEAWKQKMTADSFDFAVDSPRWPIMGEWSSNLLGFEGFPLKFSNQPMLEVSQQKGKKPPQIIPFLGFVHGFSTIKHQFLGVSLGNPPLPPRAMRRCAVTTVTRHPDRSNAPRRREASALRSSACQSGAPIVLRCFVNQLISIN